MQTTNHEAEMRIYEQNEPSATLQSFGGTLAQTNPYKRNTDLIPYMRHGLTEETKSVDEDEDNFRIDPAVSQRMSRYMEATQQTDSSHPMGQSETRRATEEFLMLV